MASRRLRRLLAALWVATFLLLPSPAAAGPDALVDQARALVEAGHAAEAVTLLEAAPPGAAPSAERLFWLGVARYRSGDPGGAREAFLQAVALDPSHGPALYNLGAGYFAEGRWEEAAEAFLRIPPVAPDMAAGAYLNAGLARYRQGDAARARDLFARSLGAGPDPHTAATARRMLALLSEEASPGAPPAPPAPPAPAPGPAAGWRVKAGVGREYDGNVLLSPNDATTSNLTDWRTVGTLRAGRPLAVSPGLRLTPEYSFYGLWYDSEPSFNYRVHRLRVRLDAPGRALRPRLEYAFSLARFGGAAYMNTHGLSARVQVAGTGPRAVWASVAFNLHAAPGDRYGYLAGREWVASLSGVRPAGAAGTLYGTFDLRYLDVGDLDLGPGQFRSYSYVSAGPFVYASRPGPLGTRATGSLRLELRRYLGTDRWTAPAVGAKRRQDRRLSASVHLTRPVPGGVEIDLSWQGQAVASNIGDSPGDYLNRDFTRQVVGLAVNKAF